MTLLEKIVQKTNNDVIIVIIVLIIGAVIIWKAMYPAIVKASEKKREQYIQREKIYQEMADKMFGVVKENSSINSELITLIRNNNQNCHECKADQSNKMDRVLDGMNDLTREVELMTSMNANLYRILVDRNEIDPDKPIQE